MDLWDSYLKTILITEVRFYSSGATCLVWFMESQLNTLSWGYYLALPLCESILKIHHGAFLWIPNSSFYTLHLSPKIVKVSWSCLTLCDPMDYTVHGILQARILEWVDFPFSKGSSQPRDWTQVSHIAGWFFTSWAMIWCELCFKKSKGRGRGWNYLDSFNVYATKLSWQLSKPNDTSIWQNLMLSVLYVWNSLWVLKC